MNQIKFIIILAVLSSSLIISQTMILKKGNGAIEYVQLNTNVEVTFSTMNPCEIIPTVLYGGQTYNTVQIGDQCWLKENLNIGNRIESDSGQTNNSTLEKYCYDNDTAKCTTYGGLYQWAEAVQYQNGATNTDITSPAFSGNIQGICPSGWHIPTNAEFTSLKNEVELSSDGNALKAVDQGSGDGAGTNISGFSALLAGSLSNEGNFLDLGIFTGFWSSTEFDAPNANSLFLFSHDASIGQFYFEKSGGYSVRCVKD